MIYTWNVNSFQVFFAILPHMLFSLEGGMVNALISFVIYLVLYIAVFGFVFAFLQRKRDVLSAMVAHGLVDAIRFYFWVAILDRITRKLEL